MARLYSNENFQYSVVLKLREYGHDVLTVLEAGNANKSIPDDEVLKFANDNNRILITLNRRDFIKLHNDKIQHKGIIVCTVEPHSNKQAEKIHNAIKDNISIEGKLIRIYRG